MKCETCGDFLSQEELPENSTGAMPLPGFPIPMEKECMICYGKRADADSPLNLNYPTNIKEHEEYIEGLEADKKKRRGIN